MTLLRPEMLWLLLLLVPMVLVHRQHRMGVGRARAIAVATSRIIALALVVFALARPILPAERVPRTTVAVVDVSRSMGDAAQAEARRAVAALAAEAREGELLSVAFAERPRRVSSPQALLERSDARDGSDLASALDLAGSLIRHDGHGDVRLFTDGGETRGDAAAAAYRLAQRGIAVTIVPSVTQRRSESILQSIIVPVYAAAGATVVLEAEVAATDPTAARLAVDRGGAVRAAREIELAAGVQRVRLDLPVGGEGLERVTVRLDADTDTDPANNVLEAAIAVGKPRQVVVFEDHAGAPAARALEAILGPAAEVTVAAATTGSADEVLRRADLLVIADTPADALPAELLARLPEAVADGLGLLVTGGRRSFGAGGYADTPLAAALPVTFPQESERRDPSTTLVVIIDTSGSMGGARVNLAKEIARLAIAHLKPHDKVGIVEFYGSKRWAAPIQPASNAIDIQRALNRLSSGGGTVILPALDEAYYALQNVRTRTRHVLVLTDGGVETGAFEPLIRRMAETGITLSTVLVGPGLHSTFLASLAQWGGGRFYTAPDRFNLPEVVIKQPQSSMLASIVESPARMVAERAGPLLHEVDMAATPPIAGYNRVEARRTADVILRTESAAPVLVSWRYGLGAVACSATHLGGTWDAALAQTPDYARLVGNLVRALSRPSPDEALVVRAFQRPGGVEIDVRQSAIWPIAGSTALELRIELPTGETRTLVLDPIAPGHWNTRLADAAPGTHRFTARTPDGALSGTAALAVAAPRETARLQENATLFDEIRGLAPLAAERAAELASAVAGPPRELWPWLTAAALVLLLLNVLLRRWPGRLPPPAATSLVVLTLLLPLARPATGQTASSRTAATADSLRAAEQQADPDGAIAALTEALRGAEDAEECFALHVRLALLHYGAGDAGAGRAALDAARTALPGDATRAFCAQLAALGSDSAVAVEALPSGTTDKERFHNAMFRGLWLARADRPAEALEAFVAAEQAAVLQRDRRFARAHQVDAARRAGTLNALADRWLTAGNLDLDGLELLASVLRELGRSADALALLTRQPADVAGNENGRLERELLALATENGLESEAETAYRALLARDPRHLDHRRSLARLLLLQERRDEASLVFAEGVRASTSAAERLALAEAAGELGLDDVALDAARGAAKLDPRARLDAVLFEADLARRRGQADRALALLRDAAENGVHSPAALHKLSDALERHGDQAAALALLRRLYDQTRAEDVLLRIAWLLEVNGQHDEALELWRDLWNATAVPARLRQAQERLLALAARTGQLADLAIELEERLDAGAAGQRELALLVDIYTTAADPVSAAEILYEFGRRSGDDAEMLRQLARVYLACEQFGRCNAVLERLITIEPDSAREHLQQMAILAVERRRPADAKEILERLRQLPHESGNIAEIAAGVLDLAGLHEEAAAAYAELLAAHPDRIEAWLLWSNGLRAAGRRDVAIERMVKLLDEAAEDDLFAIAVDGLLNLEAGPAALRFAVRRVFLRIAAAPQKVFLYRLAADLLEAAGDEGAMRQVLEQASIVAGEQRTQILRELMEGARAAGRNAEAIAYGRTLLGLGDELPPNVFLDLGQTLLAERLYAEAARAFEKATAAIDFAVVQQRVAKLYEEAGQIATADRILRELLIAQPDDLSLLLRSAALAERLDEPRRAGRQYERAVELLVGQLPTIVTTGEAATRPTDASESSRYRARNVDEIEQHFETAVRGLLRATSDADEAARQLQAVRERVLAELAAVRRLDASPDQLATCPRLARLVGLARRLSFALHAPELAGELDAAVVAAFPDDAVARSAAVRARLDWGLDARAAALAAHVKQDPAEPELAAYAALLDDGRRSELLEAGTLAAPSRLRLAARLTMNGRPEAARDVLRRLTPPPEAWGDIAPSAIALAAVFGDEAAVQAWAGGWLDALMRQSGPAPARDVARCIHAAWSHLGTAERAALAARVDGLIERADAAAGRGALALMRLRLADALAQSLPNESELRAAALAADPGASSVAWLVARAPEAERGAVLRAAVAVKPPEDVRAYLRELATMLTCADDAALVDAFVALYRAAPVERGDASRLYGMFVRGNWHRHNGPRDALPVGQAALRRKLAELVLEAHGDSAAGTAVAAQALCAFGDAEAAAPQATAAIEQLLQQRQPDFLERRLVDDLAAVAPRAVLEEVLTRLDAHDARSGATATSHLVRSALLDALDRPDAALDALRAAFAAAPDNRSISRQLLTRLEERGAVAELTRLLAENLTRSTIMESFEWRALSRLQLELYRPAAALAAAQKDASPLGPVMVLKAAQCAGDTAQVRDTLRQFLATGEAAGRFWDPFWPEDPTPRGLSGWLAERSRSRAAQPRMFAALGTEDFVLTEYAALLRAALPSQRDVPGLAAGLVRAQDRHGTCAGTLDALAEHGAQDALSDVDRWLALEAWATCGDGDTGPRDALLADVLRHTDPDDRDRLHRLIEITIGRPATYCGLVAWRAARDATSPYSLARLVEPEGHLPRYLEGLAGDQRRAAAERLARFYAPGPLDEPVDAAMAVWLDLAEREELPAAAEALARCQQLILAPATDRSWPATAAALCRSAARGRRWDEYAAALPAALALGTGRRIDAAVIDVRQVLPSELERDDAERAARLVAQHLNSAVESGLLPNAAALRSAALLADVCLAAGATETARALLGRLSTLRGAPGEHWLWEADVARRLGDDDTAYALELELAETALLPIVRVPRLLDECGRRAGEPRADALATRIAEYCDHPAVLERAQRFAAQGCDPSAADPYLARLEAWAPAVREALLAVPPGSNASESTQGPSNTD